MDFFPTFHSHFSTLKTQKGKAAISRHQPNSAISFWWQTLPIRNVRRQCHANAFNHQYFLSLAVIAVEMRTRPNNSFSNMKFSFDLCAAAAAAADVHLEFRRFGRPKSLSPNLFFAKSRLISNYRFFFSSSYSLEKNSLRILMWECPNDTKIYARLFRVSKLILKRFIIYFLLSLSWFICKSSFIFVSRYW